MRYLAENSKKDCFFNVISPLHGETIDLILKKPSFCDRVPSILREPGNMDLPAGKGL
jgi:hypothetical protein